MADTLQVAMGISPHPHNRKHYEDRWQTFHRRIKKGAFGKERTELQEVLKEAVKKR